MHWLLPLWVFRWVMQFKELDLLLFEFMEHFIISWELLCHLMVNNLPMLSCISMIQQMLLIHESNVILNWMVPYCWICMKC